MFTTYFQARIHSIFAEVQNALWSNMAKLSWIRARWSETHSAKIWFIQRCDFWKYKIGNFTIFPFFKKSVLITYFLSLFQFVQSPESLFHLEGAREKHLPEIVIKLQKVWRGVMARRQYKKMKAALKIGLYYRHCVRRGYVRQLCSTFK